MSILINKKNSCIWTSSDWLHPVEGPSPQPSAHLSDLNVSIALRKSKRSYTDHPISQFVFYDRLNLSFCQFALSLSSISIPRSYEEVILVFAWKQAMDEEMNALVSWWTWELVFAPTDAVVVGCRWVYILKYIPDGSMDRYEARLVAKDYTQTYGVDYFETFSPVAWLNSIVILFSLTINSMVICRRTYIWSNLWGMLLGGRIKPVISLRQYMDSSRVHRRGLRSLVSPSLAFVFHNCHLDRSVFVRRIKYGLVILTLRWWYSAD